MRQLTRHVPFSVALLAALALGGGAAVAANSLSIGSASGTQATIPVSLSADDDVQGFVLAVEYDTTMATVTDVTVEGTATEAAGADLVVAEIFDDADPSGFTLGVVVDSTGQTGNVIPAGDRVIAAFTIQADVAPECEADPVDVPLRFVDATLNEPKLSNIIVIAGLSIGRAEGLGFSDGVYTIPPVCDTLWIEGEEVVWDELAAARVLMRNPNPVQGFVLSLAHDPAVAALEEISLAGTVTEAAGAEFVVPQIYPDGGTLGVVLDFDPPYAGQTIPAGDGQEIAAYRYRSAVFDECPGNEPELLGETAVSFVDNRFGSPPLENVLVVAGLSRRPLTEDGAVSFTCKPVLGRVTFYAGAQSEEKSGDITCVEAVAGDVVPVGFFYTSLPQDELTGMIQGLSLGVCWPCELAQAIEDGFSIEGTISETLGAEFVNWHVDNDAGDGDGCELVVGILLDAVPPFEDQRYPVTLDMKPLEIGRMDFAIAEGAPCDGTFEMTFCDGINGAGTVPISNRASIDNRSVAPQLVDGCVHVLKTARFIRGDCNWDKWVDIADPAAMINALFVGEFLPPCRDACDANDDGRMDLADSVVVLRYLFEFGPPTPEPGPLAAGPDPTEDRLDCEAGAVCED